MKIYRDFSNFYDEMNYLKQSGKFWFEVAPSCKNAQVIAFIMHEALLWMKFPHTKPHFKRSNKKSYDLYYPIILNSTDGRENWISNEISSTFLN